MQIANLEKESDMRKMSARVPKAAIKKTASIVKAMEKPKKKESKKKKPEMPPMAPMLNMPPQMGMKTRRSMPRMPK